MKKSISIILTLVLLLSTTSFASAEGAIPLKADISKGVIITEVTEDEYVQIVSQNTGTPVQQVKENLDKQKEKISLNANVGIQSSGYSYYTAIKSKDFSPNTPISTPVELGMAYTVYYYDNWRQVNSIDAVWTGASGSGTYTWNEYTKYTYPSSFPTSSIEAHTRGAVETAIDLSVSGNAEIKQALLGVGFSVTVTYGTTCYLRKVDNIDLILNLY